MEGDKRVVIEFSFASMFWVIAILLTIWLFINLRSVILAVLLAFILATAIAPLIDYFEKRKIPRPLSITLIYFIIVATVVLFFRFILPPFISQLGDLYQSRLTYIDTISGYLGSFGEPIRNNAIIVFDKFSGSFSGVEFNGIVSSARGIFGGFFEAILVFVLSFYFLLSKNGLEKIITQYVPKQFQKRVTSIYRKISKKMSFWLRGQVLLGIIIFFINLIGLSIMGVDFALTLAIISGFMELLPIIGPVVSGILATAVGLTMSPILGLIVAAWYVLVQQLENHIIVPQVMKKSLGLSPVAVIIALLVGGQLLGVIGILISVPVASALGVLLEEFVKIKETEVANSGN